MLSPKPEIVTFVVQAIGKATMLLSMLEAGDSILDTVGPPDNTGCFRRVAVLV